MEKILSIDLEKRKALENIKNLALLGFGSAMLLNLNKESFLSESTSINPYEKYLKLSLNTFYIPNTLLYLLQFPKQYANIADKPFYINILINSNTKYEAPLAKYSINSKKMGENIIYSLENDKAINNGFNSLNSLKEALERKNFYINFLDLESKNSLLNFYNILLKDENLKKYFYIKDNKFYIDKTNALKINSANGIFSSLKLYLRLLNDFESLDKIKFINILEHLAQNNLMSLYIPKLLQEKKDMINNHTMNQENYILSNVILNLRVKED